jgi:2-furoyl-CoA dehydrogenase large subunit
MSITKAIELREEITKLKYIGVPVPRFEDLRLITGQGTFIDDFPTPPNLHYAAIVRSPYAHARIKSIDVSEALKVPGVRAVITGQDIKDMVNPFPHAIRSKVRYYPLAIDKVRFVGEPVAVVVAKDRFTAEDAMSLVQVDYEPLPTVVDPLKAMEEEAPILHEEVGSNVIWHRTYRFGDPELAFERADKVVRTTIRVNRFTIPPLEPYGIMASYDSASGILTEWCNFQGPFTFYYITARALRLTEDRFRVVVPKDIGGGYGAKTGMFHYMALIGVVAMLTRVPVKWIETRTEHFIGSTRAAGRVATFELAVTKDGTITALRAKIVDDVGAYPRSPEPGHLLRQLGNFVGPYRIKHVAIEARSVVTNTVPTSPIRGFGGQHLYFPLEKLVHKAAKELGMDPAEIRLKNFIQPGEFPYETPTGGIYDSGNYPAVFRRMLELIDYWKTKEEIEKAQKEGRLLGLGIAVGIDPSTSNMGYLDTATPPEERKKSTFLPKSGGQHTAIVKIEPMGRAIVQIDSCPQGQGHETAIAQIVASVLGVKLEDVRVVAGVDTHRNPWSVSAGTYSSRFGSVGVSAVYSAAMKVRKKMLKVASLLLNVPPEELEVGDGKVYVRDDPSRSVSIRRIAGSIHWNPGGLMLEEDKTLYAATTYHIPTLRPPGLDDRTNSSGTYGFIADAILVEVDPETGMTKILKYVSVHDPGTVINPGIVEQQCIGAAHQAIEQSLFQELVYNEDGQPMATNFGDYYVNTAKEAINLVLDHVSTKSPFTLLGSKGVGESNNETAPAAIALAIEDALRRWNIEVNELPITPERLWRKMEEAKK